MTIKRRRNHPVTDVFGAAGDAIKTIIWDSLREGMIDLRPLGPALRLLTVFGLCVLLAALGAILFGDQIRLGAFLEPLFVETRIRGMAVPALLVPLTAAMVALGWCYMLTGALYARAAARWTVLAIFLLLGNPLSLGAFLVGFGMSNLIFGSQLLPWLSLALLTGLLLAFIVLPRVRPPVGVSFALMLALCGGLALLNLQASVILQNIGGGLRVSSFVSTLVFNLLFLAAPLWLLAGSELVNAGATVGAWAERSAARLRWPAYLLVGLLIARLSLEALALRTGDSALLDPGGLAGAALVAVGVLAVLAWRRRQPHPDRLPGQAVPLLVLLWALPTAVPTAVASWLFGLVRGLNSNNLQLGAEASTLFGQVMTLTIVISANLRFLMIVAGIVVAVLAVRRSRPTLASFGALMAWGQLVSWLAGLSGPLAPLKLDYAQLDLLLLAALAGLTAWWERRGELTTSRATGLIGLLVLGWVLHQTDFLDNPFAPILGGSALALLVVGVLWSMLTAGGRFANTESPGFPRSSRILLYLGYVMLALSMAVWHTLSHNFEDLLRPSQASEQGFTVFGLALFYLILVQAGAPRPEGDGA